MFKLGTETDLTDALSAWSAYRPDECQRHEIGSGGPGHPKQSYYFTVLVDRGAEAGMPTCVAGDTPDIRCLIAAAFLNLSPPPSIDVFDGPCPAVSLINHHVTQ